MGCGLLLFRLTLSVCVGRGQRSTQNKPTLNHRTIVTNRRGLWTTGFHHKKHFQFPAQSEREQETTGRRGTGGSSVLSASSSLPLPRQLQLLSLAFNQNNSTIQHLHTFLLMSEIFRIYSSKFCWELSHCKSQKSIYLHHMPLSNRWCYTVRQWLR